MDINGKNVRGRDFWGKMPEPQNGNMPNMPNMQQVSLFASFVYMQCIKSLKYFIKEQFF